MEIALIYSFIIVFLYLNIRIIFSDIKNKIIPNKYLVYLILLLPLYYLYLGNYNGINYIEILYNLFFTIIISFIIYYFGIWGAGDAKYILVLSLFILNIGIFILNLGLSTFIILFINSIFIYFVKYINDLKHRGIMNLNIKKDLNLFIKKIKNKKNKKIDIIFITKFIINFFILFLSFRIYRLHIIDNTTIIVGNNNKFLIILIISIILIILVKIFQFLLNYILLKKLGLNKIQTSNITLLIVILGFILFIFYEVLNNRLGLILNEIYKIMTLYIFIYLSIKLMIYLYKINFKITEFEYRNIYNLKKDDLIDKQFLIKKIGKIGLLKYYEKIGIKLKGRYKKRLGIGEYKNFYKNINYKLEENDIENIKNHFITIKKINKNFKLPDIRIIKTFPLGPYIFIGFTITYIFGDNIIKKLIEILNYFY